MTAERHLRNGDELAWEHHQYSAALEEYQKALELDPTLARAYFGIGKIYAFSSPVRIKDEALFAFREAVRLAPQWSEAHGWLGSICAKKRLYEEAIAGFRQAIALSDKKDYGLLMPLGECLYKVRRYAEAVQAYQEGIRIANEEYAYDYLRLGDALYASKQPEQAYTVWKRALSLCGRDSMGDWMSEDARSKMARCRRGKGEKARRAALRHHKNKSAATE